MVDSINKKLGTRSVLKEDIEVFINRELVPVVERLRLLTAELLTRYLEGDGSPEGVVTASRGAVYQRKDGGAFSSIYIKESGDDTNTGWVAK